FKLFAELLYEAERRHSRCISKWTKRPAHHVLGQVLHIVDVLLLAAIVVDTRQGLLDPVGALTAGDAPAAGLMLVELDGAQRELDNGYGLVEHHDAAGAEHG